MQRPTIHLRDLFWLMLVVSIGLAWWLDQDRIRREVMRFQAISVKSAQAKLRVAEVEFAQMKDFRLKVTGTISSGEYRRTEFEWQAAKAELEVARARELYLPSP